MNAPTTSVPQLLTPQQADVYTDTRDLLAHARRDAIRRKYHDWLICDIDAHHVETVSWKEIITYIEDPVAQPIQLYGSSGRRRYHKASSMGPSRSARNSSETADNSSVAVRGSVSSRMIGRKVRSSPSDFAT